MKAEQIKNKIRKQYTKWINQDSSCCSPDCCTKGFSEDYSKVKGYNSVADYGLGCGIPTELAGLAKEQTVLDLGSGAGSDCFVAAQEVGEHGIIYGLDFAEAMIHKARENAKKLGIRNVEFILGDIEQIPLDDQTIDVILSNCVLNLAPDKEAVFSEMYRVLKLGGHFSISDVVIEGEFTQTMQDDTSLLSSCVSGAIAKSRYLSIIKESGFKDIQLHKERELPLPAAAFEQHDVPKELRVLSVNIRAEK